MMEYKIVSSYVPVKAHNDGLDACYDLHATSVKELKPRSLWQRFLQKIGVRPRVYSYGLGIKLEPVGTFQSLVPMLTIYPRSSVYKHGMMLINSVGIVDANYRGEISANFIHYDSSRPIYKVGDAVAQCCCQFTDNINFKRCKESDFSDSERGANGYGSTGDKNMEFTNIQDEF